MAEKVEASISETQKPTSSVQFFLQLHNTQKIKGLVVLTGSCTLETQHEPPKRLMHGLEEFKNFWIYQLRGIRSVHYVRVYFLGVHTTIYPPWN